MEAVVFNESFKALVRETFPDKSDKVLSIFDEIARNKHTSDTLSVGVMKSQAIDEIRNELATKDFVRAEIAEVRSEIAEVRSEIACAKNDILKWVFGLQAGTIAILIAAMRLILS